MTDLGIDVRDLLGFDPFDPDFHADPYAHYRRLRPGAPLRRTPGGLWISPSFDVCGRILRDPRFGHGDGPRLRGDRVPPQARSFLVLDPPDHTRLRRLVSRAFTARFVERLRPRVTALVDGLLSGLRGETDLVSGFAYPLPVAVISEMLGVPAEDHERFKGWSAALARGLDPEFLIPPAERGRREEARAEFAAYFRELAARRRAEPRDDLLSALAGIEELSEDELIATCILLLVAGHETTVNLIANGTLALLRHPGQLARFRADLAQAPAVVEELLRYDPPVQLSGRVALEDAEVAGQHVRAGEAVLLLLGAANRDPDVFPDPDRLDVTRAPERHLAFGLGIHFCLGAPLARLEGQIALAALARRDLALAGDPSYKDNLILRGMSELPVRLG